MVNERVTRIDRSKGAEEQPLRRNLKRFRGGLVFKAHRRVCHSTLGWRVIKKARESNKDSRLESNEEVTKNDRGGLERGGPWVRRSPPRPPLSPSLSLTLSIPRSLSLSLARARALSLSLVLSLSLSRNGSNVAVLPGKVHPSSSLLLSSLELSDTHVYEP